MTWCSPFTRAMAKTSNYAVYTQGIDKVVKVNDTTVDFIMKGAEPGAAEPADRAAHDEQGLGREEQGA